MSLPFWSQLLSRYCEDHVGLSLPYLVGASAMHSGATPSLADAERIVSEMTIVTDHNAQYHVSVCPMLKVPVFGVFYGYGSGLRVSLGPEWGASDKEKLNAVVQNSAGPIQAGTYSRVRGRGGFEWGSFTETESNFIRDVISHYKAI